MTSYDRRRYEMLARVQNFGTTYGQLFDDSTLAREAFATVAAAIERIQSHDVAEKSATVSSRVTRKLSARKALMERMVKVAATARVIAETSAELEAHFELSEATTDQLLLTTGRQFVKNAAPFATQFVAHGMPPTFLDELQASIDAFERALRDRGMRKDDQVAARGSIITDLATARAAVRKLDVIIANHDGLDEVVREVWARDRRVGNARKPGKGASQAADEKSPDIPAAPDATSATP